jgi:hypothetical protein
MYSEEEIWLSNSLQCNSHHNHENTIKFYAKSYTQVYVLEQGVILSWSNNKKTKMLSDSAFLPSKHTQRM